MLFCFCFKSYKMGDFVLFCVSIFPFWFQSRITETDGFETEKPKNEHTDCVFVLHFLIMHLA